MLGWALAALCTAGVAGCNFYDPDELNRALVDRDLVGPSEPTMDAATADANVHAMFIPDAEMGGGPMDGGPPEMSPDSGPDTDAQVERDAGDAAMDSDTGTDTCPTDPDKVAPGECGCGVPETGPGSCAALEAALIHRYRFDGTGAIVRDSRGSSDGSLTNASLGGGGELVLSDSQADDYAALPSGLVSGLASATVEMWLTWEGGAQNQRALSFGTALPSTITSTGNDDCNASHTFDSGSWYLACGESQNWAAARDHCHGARGQLTAIGSLAEQQFLLGFVTANVWIGANDRGTEGQWAWATPVSDIAGGVFWTGAQAGTPTPGMFNAWRTQQPDDASGGEDCGYLSTADGAWNDNPCTNTLGFVCEWRGHRGDATDSGVWFTPAGSGGGSELHLLASEDTTVAGPALMPGVRTHVALVLDPGGAGLALYVDGASADATSTTQSLGLVRDVDAWLGRSHDLADPEWAGTLHELRIYNRALTDQELATSFALDSDPAFLE